MMGKNMTMTERGNAPGRTVGNGSVKTAERTLASAVKTAKAARTALSEAQTGLDAALQEQCRLDAELDRGADIDSADLAAQIAANGTTVEALRRQVDRRSRSVEDAEDAVVVARRGVALAELRALQQDLDGFDVDGERERLLGLVQDAYTETLGRLYGLQERISRARGWAEEAAQGVGAAVTVPPRFDASVPVRLGGRGLVLPVQPSNVSEWFAGLRDEVRERAAEVGLAEARRRDAEARRVQMEHQAAVSQTIRAGMSSRPTTR